MLMHAELLTFSISTFVAVVLLAPLLPPHGPRSEWGTSLHACPFSLSCGIQGTGSGCAALLTTPGFHLTSQGMLSTGRHAE